MPDSTVPLNADRPPFPDGWEQGEPSTDLADVGLPFYLEALVRVENA